MKRNRVGITALQGQRRIAVSGSRGNKQSSIIDVFVERVVERCPGLRSVWLIGSRANGTAHETSDWDFLAFGDAEVVACLRQSRELRRPDVDLLVVINGNDFENARGEKTKTGSLSLWEWSQSSDTEATYTEAKWVENVEGGNVVRKRRVALRLWPRPTTPL
jgi:predicted nucleotidyltransferase